MRFALRRKELIRFSASPKSRLHSNKNAKQARVLIIKFTMQDVALWKLNNQKVTKYRIKKLKILLMDIWEFSKINTYWEQIQLITCSI